MAPSAVAKMFSSPIDSYSPVARITSSTCFFRPENTSVTPFPRSSVTRWLITSSPEASSRLIPSATMSRYFALRWPAMASRTASSK